MIREGNQTFSTHRIRAAALIVDDEQRLLLVKHVHPETSYTWWVPPGGGIVGTETIFECVRREVWEETNLDVTPGRIVYVRQFLDIDFDRHHLELYLLATVEAGTIALGNSVGQEDEHYIKDVRFLSRAELSEIVVHPEVLATTFWDDLDAGFPEVRYLGIDRG